MHGDANPSGRAWIAVARENGRDVASVAGLPARFRTRAGRTIVGYQIGTYVVDPSMQRQGLGSRILLELTRVLIGQPDSFVYAYPNPRSQAPLDRSATCARRRDPTFIHMRLAIDRREERAVLRDPGERGAASSPSDRAALASAGSDRRRRTSPVARSTRASARGGCAKPRPWRCIEGSTT